MAESINHVVEETLAEGFENALVQPGGAGAVSARVSWEYSGPAAAFAVYRNCGTGWECLTPDGLELNYFEDNEAPLDSPQDRVHWRVLAEDPDGETIADTGPLGRWDNLNKLEWSTLRKIAASELATIKRSGGVRVEFAKFLRIGNISDEISEKSGANLSMRPSGEYESKYAPPVTVWAHLGAMEKEIESDHTSGMGKRRDASMPCKFAAWPPVAPRDLVMAAGRLYTIGDAIFPALFKGVFPVSYTVNLVPLDAGDPRFSVFAKP